MSSGDRLVEKLHTDAGRDDRDWYSAIFLLFGGWEEGEGEESWRVEEAAERGMAVRLEDQGTP